MVIPRIAYLLLFSLVYIQLNSQNALKKGTYFDDRDSKTYATITIENTRWITENMKYKTANSENHEENDLNLSLDGYYYPFEDINEVCPNGFRIPKTSDWEKYMQLLIELKKIPSSAIETHHLNKKGHDLLSMFVADKLLKPFDDPNPLNLKNLGHTQAGKIVAIGSLNFWIKHEDSEDPKYHLHLDADGYSIHTHKDYLTTKKKKLRKFSVRCVSDNLEELN